MVFRRRVLLVLRNVKVGRFNVSRDKYQEVSWTSGAEVCFSSEKSLLVLRNVAAWAETPRE
jgi:hypothetical protein